MPAESKPSTSVVPSAKAGRPGATPKAAPKSPRGFAALDPAQQRLLASQGGKASQESGRAHRFTPAEAKAAGRKGGKALGKPRTPDETPADPA